MKNKRLYIRISDDEIMWIAKEAKRRRVTVSELVRNLIFHLRKHLIKI